MRRDLRVVREVVGEAQRELAGETVADDVDEERGRNGRRRRRGLSAVAVGAGVGAISPEAPGSRVWLEGTKSLGFFLGRRASGAGGGGGA